jgi:hypothetical protein
LIKNGIEYDVEPIPGLSDYDFVKLAKTEKNARKRIRLLAFAQIAEGKSFSEW